MLFEIPKNVPCDGVLAVVSGHSVAFTFYHANLLKEFGVLLVFPEEIVYFIAVFKS